MDMIGEPQGLGWFTISLSLIKVIKVSQSMVEYGDHFTLKETA